MRVLLVEDDKELRTTLRDALQVEGYTVQTAASLCEGLALLQHDLAPDLVLLDWACPMARASSCSPNCAAARARRCW